MNLKENQKSIIVQVVNVFETGTTTGNYGAIVTYADGPGKIRQVTYGRSQTTEYGNMKELIQMYVNEGGMFGPQLQPYLPKIGVTPLVDDGAFKQLLKDAGKQDPLMAKVQDDFFDKRYFDPAMHWMDVNGFVLPFSALVIYDSYIHSGSILGFLRKRFPESPPAKGGNEQKWITEYVDTRRNWLANHSNAILQKTVYRMDCFKSEIAKGNWNLTMLPIMANGVQVTY